MRARSDKWSSPISPEEQKRGRSQLSRDRFRREPYPSKPRGRGGSGGIRHAADRPVRAGQPVWIERAPLLAHRSDDETDGNPRDGRKKTKVGVPLRGSPSDRGFREDKQKPAGGWSDCGL
jgi:hypothetical protein